MQGSPRPRDESSTLISSIAALPEDGPLETTRPPPADGMHSNDPQASPSSSSAIVLRPYQESAIDACLSAIAAGKSRIGVSSPTGSGKTTMFMSLIPRFPDPAPRSRAQRRLDDGGRKGVLIVVSSVELALQTEVTARRVLGAGDGPELTVEVEQSKRSASGIADV